MKIAIEGQRLFRKNKHGMDFVALQLIRNLQKIDQENEYFVFVKPGEDVCLEDTANFHIVPLSGATYPYWEQVVLPAAVKKYQCDLLHCTSNTAPLKVCVPLVVTIHDIIYLESLNHFRKRASWYQRMGNIYRRWNVPFILQRAQYVITVSGFEKATIAGRFPEYAGKIRAIYNGVSDQFKRIKDNEYLEEVKQKYQLPNNFIFHLGNTDPKKNTLNVFRAYDLYRKSSASDPMPLVLLDYDRSRLKKELERLGLSHLSDSIKLCGYVPNDELPAIYNLCNLFLYPSLRESFGLPILEAMKCGTPTITSNTSSMPEIAGDAAILVDPFSPEEIALGIEKVLSSKGKRMVLREKGWKRTAAFSWEKMAGEVLDLYGMVLNIKETGKVPEKVVDLV
ncbi:glycosyltransferase family 1 protein [Marinilabiliaceae bacterium JC017]|nr:glycosyltransferase family 1 protein [Marinilabiliaceae bacterium JC017]